MILLVRNTTFFQANRLCNKIVVLLVGKNYLPRKSLCEEIKICLLSELGKMQYSLDSGSEFPSPSVRLLGDVCS